MRHWFCVVLSVMAMAAVTACNPSRPSSEEPLKILLIPADGGTESGTLADYQPLFNAVARSTGMAFDLHVAQSYGAVVEGMCNGTADIAFVGPTTYLQAYGRHCAELLAVAVKDGKSIYYSGLFARPGSSIDSLAELRGKRVAFGDINSTSSFVIPMVMLIDAKIDPAKDLAAIRMTGSHAGSLAALLAGEVDAAALSFDSYDKAVREKVPGARDLKLIARSQPIPYPPLIVSNRLPAADRERLREAFQDVAHAPGITPAMLRGYGGAQVDGYDGHFSRRKFDGVAQKMALVDDAMKSEVLRKAAER